MFLFKFLDKQNSTEKSINELVENFDYWMKNLKHPEESTHTKELLKWLKDNDGALYIKGYNHFCDLANKITEKGYQIDTMIPEVDFNEAMKIAQKQLKADEDYFRNRPKH